MDEKTIEENLRLLASKKGVEYIELKKLYDETLLSSPLQQIEAGRREGVALSLVSSRVMSIPTQVEIAGVLVGFSNITKKGTRSIYFLDQSKQMCKIVIKDAEEWNPPELMKLYNLKVSKGQQSNIFFTNIKNFEYVAVSDKKKGIMKQTYGDRVFDIKEAITKLPPMQSTGYPDDTKWIGVRAYVSSKRPLDRVVVTTLVDTSIMNNIISSAEETQCSVEGQYIGRSGLTAWIPKEFEDSLIVESEIIAYGVLQKRQGDGEVQFYCFYVEEE